jgi:hypothetical protein
MTAGDLYFNTTSNEMRNYTGAAWVAVYLPASGYATSGANSNITSLSGLTTPLSAPQGGTGQSSYAVGDILYASTTTALSKLADVATGNAIISGGVSTAPSWGKIALTTHVSGTLPVANGGTGAATLTANNVVLGNGTSAVQFVAPSTSGNLLTSNGTTWQSTAPAASGALAAKTCTFNSSGTWTKPSGYGTTARVFIQSWGGGGSGNNANNEGGGGGGAYNYRWMSIACLASTVSVTIGAGGAAVNSGTGNTGGTTTFGSHVYAYGGGGALNTCGYSGGGGGGQLSAGAGFGRSGNPFGCIPFWVAASTRGVVFEGSGGVYRCSNNIFAQSGYYKGGGGGGGAYYIRNGAGSVWGGGGGGGVSGCLSTGTGGVSIYGGNGGAGANCASGVAGTQPAGGGGGSHNGALSGAGGDGRVVVTVYAGV